MLPKTVIRKYGDRRLYDTAAKRYVKLEDIKRMVREGADIEVVDSRTGKDLTRVVLTQIIVEDSRDKGSGPPLQLLREMVRASDRATHEFLAQVFQDAKSVVSTPLDYVRRIVAEMAETEELRRRVQELEARLAEPEKAKARKRKKAG